MLGKIEPDLGDLFRSRLTSMIDTTHALVTLGDSLNWSWIEEELSGYYADKGRPSVPVRTMVGLLLLKQMYNESDESVLDRWVENPYWQYFTGETYFQKKKPFDPTDFVLFRKRIGEQGMEKVLGFTVQCHADAAQEEVLQMDTTVQEKNITYPTDQKLASRMLTYLRKMATWTGVKLKQTYWKEERQLRRLATARTQTRAGGRKRAAAIKRLKTIAGRVIREMERKLNSKQLAHYQEYLNFFKEVLAQKRADKNKVYSLHEPAVSCIAKGKAHKKYEFGAKCSVARTANKGVITAMKCFEGNPYDGDTIEATLKQHQRVVAAVGGGLPQKVIYDRGGRGRPEILGVQVLTPGRTNRHQSVQEQNKLKKFFRERSAIEATIGHLKQEYGLDRNYLSGVLGDAVNALLSGAAWNLMLKLRQIRTMFFVYLSHVQHALWLLIRRESKILFLAGR
jgi:IS5 family transposase